MNTSPAGLSLDRELALARLGGDAELLREIAQLFLSDYPGVLAELRDAVACRDARRIERMAHGLKGSVSNFGAAAAVEAARTIEALGRAAQVEQVEQVLHTLELALAVLRTELESL
jgi:HPt (histidine-containing phosphotransfer) domain-containing protein